jgi:hypothetical protein
MGTLPDINKKEKVRTPYWEAFTLDRTWQPPPQRKFTTKSTFGAQVCYPSEKKKYLFATQFATRLYFHIRDYVVPTSIESMIVFILIFVKTKS